MSHLKNYTFFIIFNTKKRTLLINIYQIIIFHLFYEF